MQFIHISRQTIHTDAAIVALFLGVFIFRIIYPNSTIPLSRNIVIHCFMSAAIILWMFSVRRRMVYSSIRRYMFIISMLLLYWIMLRTMRYVFIPKGVVFDHYCWYGYHVAYILIPLYILFCSLCICRLDSYRPGKYWNALFIPAFVLILLILTNDFHSLAFRFNVGFSGSYTKEYTAGPVLIAELIWDIGIISAALIIAVKRCIFSAYRRRAWIPFAVFVLGIFLMLAHGKFPETLQKAMSTQEIGCMTCIIGLEALILIGFYPSNDGYASYWHSGSLRGGILGSDGRFYFVSHSAPPVTAGQVQSAAKEPFPLAEGSLIMQAIPIRGGYAFWIEDMSEIYRLNRELSDTDDFLEEENEMLRAENELKQERIKLEEEERLYDEMATYLKPQMEKLKKILADMPEDEKMFRQTIREICYLNAYIKRASNLILLTQKNGASCVDAGELNLALSESLDNVRFACIPTSHDLKAEGNICGKNALAAYSVFEKILEEEVPGCEAVFCRDWTDNGQLVLEMEIASPVRALTEDFGREVLAGTEGNIMIEENSASAQILVLRIPMEEGSL